jgi:hypothetical protein
MPLATERVLHPMSIAHELSNEIAVAILSRKGQPDNLNDLKEMVLRVHKALENLTPPGGPIRIVANDVRFERVFRVGK